LGPERKAKKAMAWEPQAAIERHETKEEQLSERKQIIC